MVDANKPLDLICLEYLILNFKLLSMKESNVQLLQTDSIYEIGASSNQTASDLLIGIKRKSQEPILSLRSTSLEPVAKRARFKKFHSTSPIRVHNIAHLISARTISGGCLTSILHSLT
ncbi:hypothetical protein LIER_35735 [Lithospermum erythrorhizon]|uniref:Uncharacterized protein n=1 Tax=Lithospermum erythrorhizon TaxID=34254 RepID=A0AAV3NX04_LITER